MRYLIAALAFVIPASAQHPAMHTREFFYVGGAVYRRAWK